MLIELKEIKHTNTIGKRRSSYILMDRRGFYECVWVCFKNQKFFDGLMVSSMSWLPLEMRWNTVCMGLSLSLSLLVCYSVHCTRNNSNLNHMHTAVYRNEETLSKKNSIHHLKTFLFFIHFNITHCTHIQCVQRSSFIIAVVFFRLYHRFIVVGFLKINSTE